MLIIDEAGWVFTPTALYLEPEPHSEETPNAIRLTQEQIAAGAWTVAARAHRFADPVEQFWRSWHIGLRQSRVWHLAAFLAGLPSKGQEIDDKLQSNYC
jgi:hypothetical protein